jgi:leucine dehydrogenase
MKDMTQVRLETTHVVGTPEEAGGCGDPSLVTALGVLAGIKACLEIVYGTPDLTGRRVAIQGVGKVGYCLAELVHREGAELFLCDVAAEKVQTAVQALGAKQVDESDFWGLPVDVLSPCALGGILNDETIPQIRATIIAGAANNQLRDEVRHSRALSQRGILYAPDYVINAGGLISVYSEIEKIPRSLVLERAEKIGETVRRVVAIALAHGISTQESANHLAQERIALARSG